MVECLIQELNNTVKYNSRMRSVINKDVSFIECPLKGRFNCTYVLGVYRRDSKMCVAGNILTNYMYVLHDVSCIIGVKIFP